MATTPRYSEIQEWLVKVFGGDEIPKYEINDQTMTVLYSIMKCNKQRELDAQKLIDDTKYLGNQIEKEGKKLKDILLKLEMGPDALSTDIQCLLNVIVYSAITLELQSPSETNFLFGLNHLQEEILRLQDQEVIQKNLLTALKVKTKEVVQAKNRLEKTLEMTKNYSVDMEKDVAKYCSKNTICRQKMDEYRRKLDRLQMQFSKIGITSEIDHSSLKEKYKHLLKIKDNLGMMQKRLDGYLSLPPDVEITKAKIKQAECELAALEAKVDEQIGLLYM